MDNIQSSAPTENMDEIQPSLESERHYMRRGRNRVSTEQADRNRQRRREQEHMRARNTTLLEHNARLERRRMAQRLRRSILPPNHMGVTQPSTTNYQERIANLQTSFQMVKQSSHDNPPICQRFNYPTIGRSTITPLRQYATINSIRTEGSSSNSSNIGPRITNEGSINNDDLLQMWDDKLDNEFFDRQSIAKLNNADEKRVKKALIYSPGWAFPIELDNYYLRKRIVQELISQLESSDGPIDKKRCHKRRRKRDLKKFKLFYKVRTRRKCELYRSMSDVTREESSTTNNT